MKVCYIYDNAGNRTECLIDGTTHIWYTYNNGGELVTVTSNNGSTSEVTEYEYDASGSLILKTEGVKSTAYTYDVWDNMTSAGETTYSYGSDGARTGKTINGKTTEFIAANGMLLCESDDYSFTAYSYGTDNRI